MPSICRQPIFGALRDQASDVILTGIPEQRSTKTRNRRTSDQSESGKHDEVLQMFSLNVNLLTNLPMGPNGSSALTRFFPLRFIHNRQGRF